MLKLVKALLVELSITVFGIESGNVQSSTVQAAGTEYYVAAATVNCKIVNNAVYNNDLLGVGSGQLYVQYDKKNNVIKNNIFVASSTGVLIYNEYTKNSGNVVDYNLYYSPGGSTDALWTWKNKDYVGFSAYQAETGNDAHSLFKDPTFVNASGGDFHLQSSSLAIDAGSTDNAIIGSQDIVGQPRVQGSDVNIGADE